MYIECIGERSKFHFFIQKSKFWFKIKLCKKEVSKIQKFRQKINSKLGILLLICWPNFWIFRQSLFFYTTCDFKSTFRFLNELLVFAQNFDFWAKLLFLNKIQMQHLKCLICQKNLPNLPKKNSKEIKIF